MNVKIESAKIRCYTKLGIIRRIIGKKEILQNYFAKYSLNFLFIYFLGLGCKKWKKWGPHVGQETNSSFIQFYKFNIIHLTPSTYSNILKKPSLSPLQFPTPAFKQLLPKTPFSYVLHLQLLRGRCCFARLVKIEFRSFLDPFKWFFFLLIDW